MRASIHYDRFLKEQELDLSLFERLALKAYGLLKINLEYDEYNQEMESAGIFIEFRHAFNLGVLAAFATLPVSAMVFFMGRNSITNWVAIGLPFLSVFVFTYFPLYVARLKKLRILGQAPLGVLYLVIAMDVTPNLESSVSFAARNMPDPMGRVFKLLLWLVETRKMPNMEAALNWYSSKLRDWAPHVAEGLYLVAGSMREVGDMRDRTLEKAINVVLDGTKREMEDFARGLDMPVMATNAFGIMLPVLMLVMLPIVSVFMDTGNIGPVMFIIYDFLLPLFLTVLIVFILGKRPGSLSEIEYKRTNYRVKILGAEFNALPTMLITMIIFLGLQLFLFVSNPAILSPVVPGSNTSPSMATIPLILGLGVPAGLYYMSWAQKNQETKKRIKDLEEEFASALYQLGNAMSQGVPLEQAMESVADRMKGSETEVFFRTATSRMKTLGWPLEKVFFDEENGLMKHFPSNLIRNIMSIVLRSAEKGPTSASMTAISISKYLKVMQGVRDKINDMLADSISSIYFQGAFLIPIITGTVVGLGEITSNLLIRIGSQLTGMTQLGATSGLGYAGDFLNIQGALQPSFLQAVVGVYVLFSCVLMGLFVGGLKDGWDRMSIYVNVGKVTLMGTLVYVMSAAFVSLVFGGISQAVI